MLYKLMDTHDKVQQALINYRKSGKEFYSSPKVSCPLMCWDVVAMFKKECETNSERPKKRGKKAR
jgi:hypothetical protein